jgi:hypothetical protein
LTAVLEIGGQLKQTAYLTKNPDQLTKTEAANYAARVFAQPR